jgi:hypothetical protein
MSAPFLPMITPGRADDGDAALLVRALDHDARDAGLVQTLLQRLANLQVFVQQLDRIRRRRRTNGCPRYG